MGFRHFSNGDSHTTFRAHVQAVIEGIRSLDNEYILSASLAELEAYYIDKVTLEPLILKVDEQYIAQQASTQMHVPSDYGRVRFPRTQLNVPGTRLDVAIPYEGNQDLWRVRPSSFFLSFPEIELQHNAVILSFAFPDDSPDSAGLKSTIDRQVTTLANAVSTLNRDVESHNQSATREVKAAIHGKREMAQSAVSSVAALGIPMKRRDKPLTYTAPTQRRKSPVRRPQVSTEPYRPEPVLAEEEYGHILDVMRSMALVIERSPSSFSAMDEEAIRTHFLLQLNGHYEGAATAETFNAAGKTDILIRVDNKNIFVAECKFWRGSKHFGEAIDQLLSYLSWRDTKCALLVFNKTKDSVAVRQKIHEVMETRSEHRNTISHAADGDSRYIFVKESEPGREIIITTQLYDVPVLSS